jgi:hypothetical protein
VFPGERLPLRVYREDDREVIASILDGRMRTHLGLVTLSDSNNPYQYGKLVIRAF